MVRQTKAEHLVSTDAQRPEILNDLTTTQIYELQSQFDERDRQGFNWRAESFGWTPDQANEVWSWFEVGHRAVERLQEASVS